jgi:hypothetical protein
MSGAEDTRIPADKAGYMELAGAVKDDDCHKVKVDGGISKYRGCCNEFERENKQTTQFQCGTCEYRKSLDPGMRMLEAVRKKKNKQ